MAFSLLGLVNLLSPKDGRSKRIAGHVPFGSHHRQKLDVYAPRQVSGPLPVIVFFYGGGWNSGDRTEYQFVGRCLAGLGYVVVVPDYRFVPEVEYPAFLNDNVLAIDWAVRNIAEHGGDPERLVLMGHSAGAYNAVTLALDSRFLTTAGLLDRVKAVVGLSGPYDFFPFDVPETLRAFGAVKDGAGTQPIHHVTRNAPPMFLATGDGDRLVYPRNTIALARRLRDAGAVVEEKHYPGLTHPATLLPLGSVLKGGAPVLADVAAFLDRFA